MLSSKLFLWHQMEEVKTIGGKRSIRDRQLGV